MLGESVIISSGSTFVISSRNGDILSKSSEGFYSHDTRFLSAFRLLVNGHETQPVGYDKLEHSIASFYSVWQKGLSPNAEVVSIVRDRLVEKHIHEDVAIKNHSRVTKKLRVELLFDSDFADVLEVRRGAPRKPGKISVEAGPGAREIRLVYHLDNFERQTWISMSSNPSVEYGKAIFELDLAPKSVWKTCVAISPVVDRKPLSPTRCVGEVLRSPFGPLERGKGKRRALSLHLRERSARSVESTIKAPRLQTDIVGLGEAYYQAIRDLHSLQLEILPGQFVLAAGLPWFLALFGRDSIISAIQSKLIGTNLLAGTLRTLAALQAKKADDFSEAQPGKILHEMRQGEVSVLEELPHSCYYGSVDSTPLFLLLLCETYLWTGDRQLIRESLPAAEFALDWIDKYGDLDGDGYLEYQNKGGGWLQNEGWKDSEDSVSFADGELAEPPIALAEVQGYVFAAKSRMAKIYRLLGNEERAAQLEIEAEILKDEFDKAFWMPKKGFFATALDGNKDQVDSITSNPGHCLWTGIIRQDKAQKVVRRLMQDDMFTGWGVRTLSSEMARYDPISYHNGSIWPHDTSIIAAGMSRYGFHEQAYNVSLALIAAAIALPDHRLPELFSGYVRRESSVPIPYPGANCPQAWASGALIYSIETLLGARPADDDLVQHTRLEGISLSMSGVKYRGIGRVL